MALALVGISALIHVYIFALESLLWGRASTNKTFGMTAEVAAQNRLFAFNQGFYNLFLAVGAGAGIGLEVYGSQAGLALMIFCCLSMVAAAVVLIISANLMKRAFVQGLPPLLALGLLLLAR